MRPEFVEHPNGALSFDAVYAVIDDPECASAHYAKHWQAQWDGNRLSLPAGPVLQLLRKGEADTVLPAELLVGDTPGIKALRVLVADLVQARTVVEAAGLATLPVTGGFGVRAADAAGCAFVFEERHATDR